jgi:hypothetical protein
MIHQQHGKTPESMKCFEIISERVQTVTHGIHIMSFNMWNFKFLQQLL